MPTTLDDIKSEILENRKILEKIYKLVESNKKPIKVKKKKDDN